MKRLLPCLLMVIAFAAHAGGFARTAPPELPVIDRAGAAVPLDAVLRDAAGHTLRLGDFFHPGRAVLLVPGYWQCRTLCGTLMQGILEAAADTGLPRDRYTVVGFSVDPAETPQDAAARQISDLEYAAAYGSRATKSGELPPPDLQLLLGDPALSRSIGFDWRRTDAQDPADRWAHASGFVVVSPEGRIEQTFQGVRFDAADVRTAITSAITPATDGQPPANALMRGFAMLCAHFDPVEGRLSQPVMQAFRVGGVLLACALGLWMLRHRRTRRAGP